MSPDTFDFQHWVDYPCAFSPTETAHNHSAHDFARPAVRELVDGELKRCRARVSSAYRQRKAG
jgi:hypothetical protein